MSKLENVLKQLYQISLRNKKEDNKLSNIDIVNYINKSDIIDDDMIEQTILSILKFGNLTLEELMFDINYSIDKTYHNQRTFSYVYDIPTLIGYIRKCMSNYKFLISTVANMFIWSEFLF